MIHPVRRDRKHRYWIPGPSGEVRVPGFTEISTALGIIKPNPNWTLEGSAKGTALHQWLALLASGKSTADIPDPRIATKVQVIRNFVDRSGFKFVGGETPQYDPVTDVAVTPDLWGYIGNWSCVIEAKSGSAEDYHFEQSACQKINLRANGFDAQKRFALYLKKNVYRLVEHADRRDLDRWRRHAYDYHKNKSQK